MERRKFTREFKLEAVRLIKGLGDLPLAESRPTRWVTPMVTIAA